MAIAIRQEGNFNSKRLRACKVLNKMTIRAPVLKYTKSLKTLIHLLQSLTMLREILIPFITVIILLKSS
jgi:hypothetical protein